MKKIFTILLIMPLIWACSSSDSDNSNEISLKDKEITLNASDTYQIEAGLSGLSYSTDNDDVAMVNSKGLVTAMFVGETDIIIKQGSKIARLKVVVEPKHHLYETPSLKFGTTSRDNIIKEFGKPSIDNGESISYVISGKPISNIMYLFDDDMKLRSSSVIVKSAYAKNLIPFLTERYFPISIKELMFANSINPNKVTMFVSLSVIENASTLVMYYPYKDK